jgi:hypothetical protein
MTTDWNRKELWRKSGENFMIEISRHEVSVSESACFDSEGPHRWCVYAYIYPEHPHFSAFDGSEDMRQDAATCLPLHCGPSFFRKHLNAKGETTSYQVGADYNHLYDWSFTQHANPEDAAEVFSDAQDLFDALTRRAKAEGEQQ